MSQSQLRMIKLTLPLHYIRMLSRSGVAVWRAMNLSAHRMKCFMFWCVGVATIMLAPSRLALTGPSFTDGILAM